MPTGGVNAQNLAEFLAFKRIIAVGGSWMVNEKLVSEGTFDQVTALTREAVAITKS
jgi:2-dehydro-3-deoxyphosphogluconate aldolase/(4S)-4-hydroxy-2-oxoglutarate aldolase